MWLICVLSVTTRVLVNTSPVASEVAPWLSVAEGGQPAVRGLDDGVLAVAHCDFEKVGFHVATTVATPSLHVNRLVFRNQHPPITRLLPGSPLPALTRIPGVVGHYPIPHLQWVAGAHSLGGVEAGVADGDAVDGAAAVGDVHKERGLTEWGALSRLGALEGG